MAGIFKAYDIRGLCPGELNEELAYKIGRASVIFLKAKKILVGRDCRKSSLPLKKSLVYGITDQGADVIDTGYSNTPMIYYASIKHDALMITASHLPKEYNGIKVAKKGVDIIGEHNGLPQIEKLVNKCHFPDTRKKGKVTAKNILPDYARYVKKIVNGKYKPLKVLIDCGNGMAGHVVPTLMKGLPIKYKLLYGEMDGSFPNHIANPLLEENTAELQKQVVSGKYDIGIAYDADCDRVFFIDEKGRRVRSDHAFILFARHLCKKGDKAVFAANMSRIVREKMKEFGIKAYPNMVGHTEIPLRMKKENANFGGELSGHWYFKKFNFVDSGDVAALFMLDILSKSGKKMSELVKPLEKYSISGEINYKVADKQAAMKKVEEAFKKYKKETVDGISFFGEDFWFNLRLSKTENVVRLNADADSKKKLDQVIDWVSKLLQG
ncbi:MAG: phosphomannomutase/phosphoglucomutase [Candidatus Woesearchaeota archaeon]